MSKIVVADRIRLGQDGGIFKKDQVAAIERKGAKVSIDFIEKENKTWVTSGRLWKVDEEETAKRDALVKKGKAGRSSSDIEKKLLARIAELEAQKGGVEKTEREKREARATELGITFPKNIGDGTLDAKIAEAEAKELTGE